MGKKQKALPLINTDGNREIGRSGDRKSSRAYRGSTRMNADGGRTRRGAEKGETQPLMNMDGTDQE
jgi:hypothetical protein